MNIDPTVATLISNEIDDLRQQLSEANAAVEHYKRNHEQLIEALKALDYNNPAECQRLIKAIVKRQ